MSTLGNRIGYRWSFLPFSLDYHMDLSSKEQIQLCGSSMRLEEQVSCGVARNAAIEDVLV